MLVAAARPDLVSKLVLLETSAGGDGDRSAREKMRRYFESWTVPFPDERVASDFLGEGPLERAWVANLERREDGLWPRFEPDALVETMEAVDEGPRWAEWKGVAAPTLVVFAQNGIFDEYTKHTFVARGRDVQWVDIPQRLEVNIGSLPHGVPTHKGVGHVDTAEITELVRQRGRFASAEQTRMVIGTVLSVLGSADLGGEAKNLAAQLPKGFAELLGEKPGQGEQFGAEEFITGIQQRLEITGEQAEVAARAVLSSVTDAVSEGERASFVNALPKDLSGYTRWT